MISFFTEIFVIIVCFKLIDFVYKIIVLLFRLKLDILFEYWHFHVFFWDILTYVLDVGGINWVDAAFNPLGRQTTQGFVFQRLWLF